ncbi:MAG: hypothetical protein SFV54_17270 [Bryobacteraceae bacterium]|nr:hypothetical protein [Bryobacteraceae bacterium]
MTRVVLSLLAAAAFLGAQSSAKYDGPRPPKADVPYLLHASSLIETEAGEARQSERKDLTVYTMVGASSSVRTPLPEPIFVIRSEKIPAEKLVLYRMETKGGAREIAFNQRKPKDNQRPVYLLVKRLEQGLYRIEANETLTNGEYCLSPESSNQTFCFAVY